MAPRVQPIELTVQHMRKRRKGMPVSRVEWVNAHPIPPNYSVVIWIAVNVIAVVIIEELIVEG